LGSADAGDAAMGKAWGIWYDQKKDEIAIYSSYADSTAVKKDIKQIRVTSSSFVTAQHLRTGGKLVDFEKDFTDAKRLATYFDSKTKDSILIFDSRENGIGVEVVNNLIRAITVHPKGTAVNETYLSLHPEWKL